MNDKFTIQSFRDENGVTHADKQYATYAVSIGEGVEKAIENMANFALCSNVPVFSTHNDVPIKITPDDVGALDGASVFAQFVHAKVLQWRATGHAMDMIKAQTREGQFAIWEGETALQNKSAPAANTARASFWRMGQ